MCNHFTFILYVYFSTLTCYNITEYLNICRCKDGTCVSISLMCDQRADCPDSSDEHDCCKCFVKQNSEIFFILIDPLQYSRSL